MAEVSYFTKEGLEKLKAELLELKTKGRSDISKQIAEARDKGDLSENAEYDAAKEAQGLHELRISKMSTLIANARILDESKVDLTRVGILSIVKIKNKKNSATISYTLVSEEEADLKKARISVRSPIGKGLLGKEVGDSVDIQTPGGTIQFEVVEIGR